jgi:tRNA threonylcarbamoyladenosine biosynthesis protein TsaB
MLLLAVDTSGKQGSIALAQCGPGDACEVIEVAALPGGRFSAELVPQLAALLVRRGFKKLEVGGFAVVSGPGSFTGLRIGLAAIKALSEALTKPIAAVSMLEALATSGELRGRVAAVLDSGRNEVFLGEYEVDGLDTRLIREGLLSREKWLESAGGALVVTPDKIVAEAARAAGLQLLEIERPRADAIAQLGWRKIAHGEIVSPEALEARYVGQSESEIFVKKT